MIIGILDFLNKYSDAFLAITSILALIFGGSWLNTSTRKMKGKLDYDIARNYLKSVLSLRDAIKSVRNPFIDGSEINSYLQKNNITPNEIDNTDLIVYQERWKNLQSYWSALDLILIDAEVSWGPEARDIQNGLDELIRELRSTIFLFINSKESFYKHKDSFHILYMTNSEDDVFSKNVNKEVEKIREYLKKFL